MENKSYNFESYFLKSKEWADFWANSQEDLTNHFLWEGETIYEFKYKLNSKFWYVPHLGENGEIDEKFIKKLKKEGQKNFVDFISFEISDSAKKNDVKFKNPLRKIQYNATILVNTENLKTGNNLSDFVKNNPEMMANFASSFRRKIKKSLQKNWSISVEKNEQNLQNFLKIYKETALRQRFATHPDSYYKQLFKLKNSKIIILFNKKNEVCGGWLGWKSAENLTYLYGGNNEESLQELGQYIIQLTALKICAEEKLRFYDLGGWEKNTGYGRFKEGFHGILRQFDGPFDIIINPYKYYILKTMGKIKNLIKTVKK